MPHHNRGVRLLHKEPVAALLGTWAWKRRQPGTSATSNNDFSGNLPTDAAATLTATGGSLQSANVNTAFGMALQATLKTGNGNPIPNAVLPFTAPTSGAIATLSPHHRRHLT